MTDYAKVMREQADQDAIRALLASYPRGSKIGPREPGTISMPEAFLKKLPRDPKKRLTKIADELASHRKELARDIRQYERLRTQGLAAVSDFDLLMSHDAVSSCRGALELKSAHISYNRSMIEFLATLLAETEAGTVSAAIPPGCVLVSVALPAYQAYVAKQWMQKAEASKSTGRQKKGALPEGIVWFEAILPARHAFTVQKWAQSVVTRLPKSKHGSTAKSVSPKVQPGDTGSPVALGQRYEIRREPPRDSENGKIVIVSRFSSDPNMVWAYEDKPARYRKNRAGRRVMDFDPRCIESPYSLDELRIVADC
jgi:hypothetical protein